METTAPRSLSLPRQSWTFARHFLEMCIAMCAVGTPLVLLLLRALPGAAGWPDPRASAPETSVLVVALIYTAPMMAWMRLRGMAWRPILEMGGATIALGLVLVALSLGGVLPQETLASFVGPAFCGPACVLMLAVMLPRLALYTGRTGHHH